MSMKTKLRAGLPFAALLCVVALPAQTAPTYGEPVNLDTARKVAAGARVEAEKNHLQMVIAVVDPGGDLVYFEKMDGAQTGSVQVAIDKARTSAMFRRPTKFFEDAVASGGAGLRFLGMRNVVPVDGGFPLIVGGKIVGAVGASGGTNKQDGEVGFAGASALK